jgi:hypothetical protein
MYDILKPELLALVVGVVGICEASKKVGLTVPTMIMSLVLSIVAGVIAAVPLTWQGAAVTAFVVYGASTLAYEAIIKRITGNDRQGT